MQCSKTEGLSHWEGNQMERKANFTRVKSFAFVLMSMLVLGLAPQIDVEAKASTVGKVLSSSDVSAYDGSAYVEVNGNIPTFTDREKEKVTAFESYSKLDSLGRCGVAYANVCQEIMPTEKRGAIGSVKPSGWHTVKYNDLIDGNYLYNRCHLIGYQLAGENANKKNLITGTRYLNVDGMLPFENQVDDYVEATNNHVLYRVTPVFDGENLVASGVQMEAWSVEDSGKGVCFNVYCYNVQPGITINYATGDSGVDTNYDPSKTKTSTSTGKTSVKTGTNAGITFNCTYVLNTNTKKVHKPTCSSVSTMKSANTKQSNESAETLQSQGYSPCGRCKPFAASTKTTTNTTKVEEKSQPVAETPAVAPAPAPAPASVVAPEPAPAPSGDTTAVWIPSSGSKYHSNAGCSGMKNPTQTTKQDAINRGYDACKKCW